MKTFIVIIFLSLSATSMDSNLGFEKRVSNEIQSLTKTRENIQAISQAIMNQKETNRLNNAACIIQAVCKDLNIKESIWVDMKGMYEGKISEVSWIPISDVIAQQKKLNVLNNIIFIRYAVAQAFPLLGEINEETPNYTSVTKTYLRIADEGAERKEKVPPHFYNILSGSASLEDATIIFLGENHERLGHAVKNGLIIDMLAETGDIVLLEGAASDAECDQDCSMLTLGADVKLKVSGWENMDAHKRACSHKEKREELVKNLQQKFEVLTPASPFFESEIKPLIYEIESLDESFDQTVILERNDYLIVSAISQLIKNPGKRVFVSLGLLHIKKDPRIAELFSEFGFIAIEPRD